MSWKHCVKSVQIWSDQKLGPEKTPYMDTFHAVKLNRNKENHPITIFRDLFKAIDNAMSAKLEEAFRFFKHALLYILGFLKHYSHSVHTSDNEKLFLQDLQIVTSYFIILDVYDTTFGSW